MAAAVLTVFALLLVPTGFAKVRRPAPTVTAVRAVGWPARPIAARLLGVVEVAAGVAVLAGMALGVWFLAALYVGFAGFLVRARRADAPTCGCAGSMDTPPTLFHLVLTVVAAAVATWMIATGVDAVAWETSLDSALLFTSVALATWLAHAGLTDLSRVVAAR